MDHITSFSLMPYNGQTTSQLDLNQLLEKCPLLEEFSIRIKRSRGDVQGVSIYKRIRSLLHLQYLDLELDACDADHSFENDNNDDDRLSQAHDDLFQRIWPPKTDNWWED